MAGSDLNCTADYWTTAVGTSPAHRAAIVGKDKAALGPTQTLGWKLTSPRLPHPGANADPGQGFNWENKGTLHSLRRLTPGNFPAKTWGWNYLERA